MNKLFLIALCMISMCIIAAPALADSYDAYGNNTDTGYEQRVQQNDAAQRAGEADALQQHWQIERDHQQVEQQQYQQDNMTPAERMTYGHN